SPHCASSRRRWQRPAYKCGRPGRKFKGVLAVLVRKCHGNTGKLRWGKSGGLRRERSRDQAVVPVDSSVSASTWCPRAFNETRPCTHPDPARDAIAVVRMAPYPSRRSELGLKSLI